MLAIVSTSAAHFDCTEVRLTASGETLTQAAAAAHFICKHRGPERKFVCTKISCFFKSLVEESHFPVGLKSPRQKSSARVITILIPQHVDQFKEGRGDLFQRCTRHPPELIYWQTELWVKLEGDVMH